VVVVLHFDNRLTRGALADIVDGAVAFHDHQVELGDGRLGRRAGRNGKAINPARSQDRLRIATLRGSYYGW